MSTEELPKRHGERWTPAEENIIAVDYLLGVSIADIAEKQERTTNSIHAQLLKIMRDCVGLIPATGMDLDKIRDFFRGKQLNNTTPKMINTRVEIRFKTTDGEYWPKQSDAEAWQSCLDFQEFYKDNLLYNTGPNCADGLELYRYIRQHWHQLKPLIERGT